MIKYERIVAKMCLLGIKEDTWMPEKENIL
jgi:hypothetical protein